LRRVSDHAVRALRNDERAGDICAERLTPPNFGMRSARRAVYFQLGGFAIAIALLLLLSRFFPIVDLVDRAEKAVMHWGTGSIVGYPLLFALFNLLLLPGGLLSVGAGFFFGLWRGFFVVLIGNTIAAALSFALSRWIGRHWFSRKFAENRTLRLLQPAVEREGWKIVVLSQLHPMFPTSLLNYLYGLTRIRFTTCMLWTSIGRAPGLFLYVYLGTLGKVGFNVARGGHHPRVIEYWTWGGAFVTTVLLVALLTRMALRALREAEEETQPTPTDRESREFSNV
jgi:uncharacterized membrane protein YdjX (TVP38/TMEM64 family)